MSLLYDKKYDKTEWLNYKWITISESDFDRMDISIMEDFILGSKWVRPKHKHRALIDLYWRHPDSLWQDNHPTQGFWNYLNKGEQPNFFEWVSYRPSDIAEPDLYAEYLRISKDSRK